MSIRFAAARSGANPLIARVLTRVEPAEPANDTEPGIGRDRLLRCALQHFATHGLAAATRARESAERAFFDGNREQHHHWLAICKVLDRRMAETSRRRLRSAASPLARLPVQI